jgi:CheY-like chemotaxis protein
MATILIVDDEYALVESLEEILTWEGHRVLSASNGERGLALLEVERADLVLLDQMMPIMNGLTMLRQLRADGRYADIKVVLMTAAPPSEESGLPWDGLLRKPFGVDPLLRLVHEVLGRHGRDGGGSG